MWEVGFSTRLTPTPAFRRVDRARSRGRSPGGGRANPSRVGPTRKPACLASRGRWLSRRQSPAPVSLLLRDPQVLVGQRRSRRERAGAVWLHVQVSSTNPSYRDANNGSSSNLTTVADVGLLGASQAPPTCTGDLVSGQVVCSNLNAGTFAVSRNSGTPVPLTTSPAPYSAGYQGTTFLPGLKSGDVVTLDETGSGATTRDLTTLHVSTLRADVAANGSASGVCQPGQAVGGGYPGSACSSSGQFSTSYGYPSEVDDLSGEAPSSTCRPFRIRYQHTMARSQPAPSPRTPTCPAPAPQPRCWRRLARSASRSSRTPAVHPSSTKTRRPPAIASGRT